jgi:biopolymer transport protein ExbD
MVKADENVPWGRVALAMVLLTQAGAANVGMITDPLEPE